MSPGLPPLRRSAPGWVADAAGMIGATRTAPFPFKTTFRRTDGIRCGDDGDAGDAQQNEVKVVGATGFEPATLRPSGHIGRCIRYQSGTACPTFGSGSGFRTRDVRLNPALGCPASRIKPDQLPASP